MTLRDTTEEARRFVEAAIEALDHELDYQGWIEKFGVPLGNARTVLAEAGVSYSEEQPPAVARSRDAIREALARVIDLLKQAGAESETWRIDVEQFDASAEVPDGNAAGDAYSLLSEALDAGFAVRDAE